MAVSGPDGTFTVTDRWDGGKTLVLDLPFGAATWTVTVTSADGTRTLDYEMSVYRGVDRPPPPPGSQCYGELIYPGAEYHTELGFVHVTAFGGSTVKQPEEPAHYRRSFTAYVTNSTTDVKILAVNKRETVGGITVWTGSRNRLLPEPAPLGRILWASVRSRAHVDGECYQSWHGVKVVKLPPGQTSLEAGAVGPLVADLFDAPSSHDGASAFTVRLGFSRDVDITPEAMRDHALIVSGATVTGASRVDGRSDLWALTVEPSGTGPVTLLVPVGRACTETGALCTADGQVVELGDGVSISGPAQEPVLPPLTAAFENVPSTHDGASRFTLGVAFSEAVFDGNESVDKDQAIRDAVAVTGGTLRGGHRTEQGAYDRWTLTVEPSGNGDVTVSLPATSRACSEAGAICTPGGTPLTGTATATVEGPALPALAIADAETQEGPSAYLRFKITLSEASDDPVTFDIATSDGTAIAGRH